MTINTANPIRSDKYIILTLPSTIENIRYLNFTFSITQYVFYDPRFKTYYSKFENPEHFNQNLYREFMEKCLSIEFREVRFTINEFRLLVQFIDFVNKCLIGEPNLKLRNTIIEDFNNSIVQEYDQSRLQYFRKSKRLIDDFKNQVENEKIKEWVMKVTKWGEDL